MLICIGTILGRAGQQGPTRTLTAALKRIIKQLLGTYSITQVNITNEKTGEINLLHSVPKTFKEKSIFSILFLKHLKMQNLQ